MLTIDPKEVSVARLQACLHGAIGPRPIAFASTVDKSGNVNLSPFSFFNVFSIQPPILIFSPSRRIRDNTTKHTLENISEVPEVVVNIVSYSMVEQASLSSVEFPKGENEFIKSGLTPAASLRVKPPRVAESPAAFECRVNQVMPLGDQGGAGNLVICEIVLAHFKEELFDDQGMIDPQKLDAVARMGGDYYSRAHGASIFKVPKPAGKPAIGFDQIPERVRQSSILTGNDLGRLGNLEKIPDPREEGLLQNPEVQAFLTGSEESVHRLAQKWIRENRVMEAWKLLMAFYG